jgi:hypothetical protein
MMKILPFFAPLVFALSLTGPAHAAVTTVVAPSIAHATIEAGKCPHDAAIKCLSSDDSVADKADVDGIDDALPRTNANANAQAVDSAATPVPEPETFAMLVVGLALLGVTARRRNETDKFDH